MGKSPSGEAFIAPVEASGDGTIVFDGALAGYGLLREPVAVSVVVGRAVDADGEAAQWLLDTLDAGGPNGRVLAELGIGTNGARARERDLLEDVKALGTAHLAFGTSSSFGGANDASVHVDSIVLRPTVEPDGRPLMRDGELHPDAAPTRPACRPGPSASAGCPG
jgi:leucyl aminopeptidase (aminopeptidase T)